MTPPPLAIVLTTSHVKELRQTILNLAVRGKLVQQDPNNEPASELLKSIGRLKIERPKFVDDYDDGTLPGAVNFSLPQGWIWSKVQELLENDREISYGIIKLGQEPKEFGIPVLRCSDVKPRHIDLSNVRKVSGEIEQEYARTRLVGGEIVINIRGTLGGVALVPVDIAGYNVAREVAVIPVSHALCGEYLVDAMASPFFWETILSNLRGIAYKGINLGALRLFRIPVPPLAEQHRIVAKVGELMNLCDQLEVHLAANQTNQSRLLEATLCDALGVKCLPVSRSSRPAPSLKQVAATHIEQPPRPIAPHPAPVQAPTAAVQGSLIEQASQVEKPRAANGDIPGAILAQMQPGQEYSRAQLAEALGLSVYEWNMAIRELKESGRVVQTGERRGARYHIN